jgi:hypothetical protein
MQKISYALSPFATVGFVRMVSVVRNGCSRAAVGTGALTFRGVLNRESESFGAEFRGSDATVMVAFAAQTLVPETEIFLFSHNTRLSLLQSYCVTIILSFMSTCKFFQGYYVAYNQRFLFCAGPLRSTLGGFTGNTTPRKK